MAVVQAAVSVVELVQVFDQQITPVGRQPHQRLYLSNGHVIRLAPLEFALATNALAQIVYRAQ